MDELLNSQKNILGISDFLNTSNSYISENFPDVDLNSLFTSAIGGSISSNFWTSTIFELAGKELKQTLTLMVTVLIVVIIHSILKTIIENLGNISASKIAYFVQYLLIVSIIGESAITVIAIIRESIGNLVDFMNLLIPLLSTLMLTTGCVVSNRNYPAYYNFYDKRYWKFYK